VKRECQGSTVLQTIFFRSATLVIAYVMLKLKLKLKETILYVKERRFIVSPNPGFMKQLVDFEASIFGENSILLGSSDSLESLGLIPTLL
jgi:hypothetical protein